MPVLIIVIVLGLLGGVAVGLQSPLASIIGQRLGSMESVFIIHLGGAIAAGLLLIPQRGGQLAQWRSVPWYALGAGALGLAVITAVNYIIPRQGAVVVTFLIVAGQIVISLVIDQFGLFETSVRPLDITRVLGVVLLMTGVWLVAR